VVAEILVSDAESVEYEQVLMYLRPLGTVAVFEPVLIANRGEIAVRVARACRELGIEVVAVYSTADRTPPSSTWPTRRCRSGRPRRRSYLHVPNIVEAALRTGADAIHPGYGFLSEDPDFAEICADEGLTFVGPPKPEVMQQMGNKAIARRLMADAGLPLLPGTSSRWQRPTRPRRSPTGSATR
jgi:acetyl-CoA carboxylase biotin carboxylase subunit